MIQPDVAALHVAADEVLILRITDEGVATLGDRLDEYVETLSGALSDIGLDGRSMILAGGLEMAVVKRAP